MHDGEVKSCSFEQGTWGLVMPTGQTFGSHWIAGNVQSFSEDKHKSCRSYGHGGIKDRVQVPNELYGDWTSEIVDIHLFKLHPETTKMGFISPDSLLKKPKKPQNQTTKTHVFSSAELAEHLWLFTEKKLLLMSIWIGPVLEIIWNGSSTFDSGFWANISKWDKPLLKGIQFTTDGSRTP